MSSSVSDKIVVVGLHHLEVGCSYHRIKLPLNTINDGRVISATVNSATANDMPYWKNADIIMFNRVPTMPSEQLLEKRKELGFKIVVDIDDHWILYPHHEMAANWNKSKAHEQIQMWLSEADMVFTTNERLQVSASALNSNVHVVPNSLPFDRFQFDVQPSHKYPSWIDFIYAGGSSHLHDLNSIRPVMKRLGSDGQFRQKGRVLLAGYEHQYGMGKINSVWENMLRIVSQAKSYATIPNIAIDRYMECYNSAEVSLAPLERSTFNACKSNLKILEAGCKNIPIIASYVEPYIFDIECPGVILCDTSREWYSAVKKLLNEDALRESLGKELGDYVRRKYHMKDVNDIRRRLFNQLLGRDGISKESE